MARVFLKKEHSKLQRIAYGGNFSRGKHWKLSWYSLCLCQSLRDIRRLSLEYPPPFQYLPLSLIYHACFFCFSLHSQSFFPKIRKKPFFTRLSATLLIPRLFVTLISAVFCHLTIHAFRLSSTFSNYSRTHWKKTFVIPPSSFMSRSSATVYPSFIRHLCEHQVPIYFLPVYPLFIGAQGCPLLNWQNAA